VIEASKTCHYRAIGCPFGRTLRKLQPVEKACGGGVSEGLDFCTKPECASLAPWARSCAFRF
jgi:hypothetical protein